MKHFPVFHKVKPKGYKPKVLTEQQRTLYSMPAQMAMHYSDRMAEDLSFKLVQMETSGLDYRVVYKVDGPSGEVVVLYTDVWQHTSTKGWVWKSISWRD